MLGPMEPHGKGRCCLLLVDAACSSDLRAETTGVWTVKCDRNCSMHDTAHCSPPSKQLDKTVLYKLCVSHCTFTRIPVCCWQS